MIFGKQKDVPEEISKVKLGKWYSGLSDQDKVKVGRYLRTSDTASALDFSLSVMRKANQEENNSVSILLGENILRDDLSDIGRFDVLEEIIPAYYGAKRYEDCLRCCEEGLTLIQGLIVKIKERNGGSLPENIMCRNYMINVLVGVNGDYDAGDAALDRFFKMGLISEEDVAYRKQSHKIHKLQRTFDGIFTMKLKDQ
ncbi:MAG: hypothetical protein LBR42_02175 [Candidatus Methanoplasma sp.]|jgi:hypothetical protein|nr:hypothetical protein [Candidatus Methanoplasma sp.]